VNGDGFGVKDALDTHEGLDKERLSGFEVSVHDSHYGYVKICRAELERGERGALKENGRTDEFRDFRKVVVADGGSHELALISRLVECEWGTR
jgi:hypothetical protein